MSDFNGKIVVITGAGSGIGRSTALVFAREGAKLHLADVNAENLTQVANECESRGVTVSKHVTDVSDPAQVEALAAAVFDEDGAVDVLHNNAGIGHAGPTDETTLEDWQRVINVNLMGVIHGVHYFVPRMLSQGRPSHIANTASLAGLVAPPQMAPYATSKFGVVGLSQSLNAELAPRGIHVSAICPGIINTAIVETSTMRGEMVERQSKTVKFYKSRGTSPDVVAESVLHAVKHNKLIQPTPRYQVTPAWIGQRISPRLSQVFSRISFRLMSR